MGQDGISACELDDIAEDLRERSFRNGRFFASTIAEHVMKHVGIKTLSDSKEMLYYDPDTGIWRPGGKELITKFVSYVLDDELTTHRNNEVIFYIEAATLISRAKFDRNKNLLSVENGTLDINSMQLVANSKDNMLTVHIPVKFDPEAKMPLTEKFLREVADEGDIPIIQEMFGFCLWREYLIHRSFMFIGAGKNGKSTLLGLLRSMLGAKNVSSLTLQSLDKSRFAAAALNGKLANISTDIPKQSLFNTGMFKMLCGNDAITTEQKFRDPFEFVNHAKLVFSCNELPMSYDFSNAFFRRWIIIKFRNTFNGVACDPQLPGKLEAELPALLLWALSGLRRIKENGEFSTSKSTEQTQDEYERLSNPISGFVKDRLEKNILGHTTKDDMYNAYLTYCDENDITAVDKTVLGKRLQAMLPYIRSEKITNDNRRIHTWKGVVVKPLSTVSR